MGARGPKQKFTEITCPNEKCRHYGMLNKSNIIANGTYQTNTGMVRKYKCKTCGRVFNDRTGTAYEHTHLTKAEFDQIASCQANGVGVRRTADIVGCTSKTVLKRTMKSGEHASKVSASLESKGVKPKVLQFDELLYTLKKPDLPRRPFQRRWGLDMDFLLF